MLILALTVPVAGLVLLLALARLETVVLGDRDRPRSS
jgi:hypothetical protein